MSGEHVARGLKELARLADRTAAQADHAAAIAARYVKALKAGGTLFFAGNGGSAADAQHLATEYVVRYKADRRPYSAVALTTDTSLLTAAGNDLGFDEVFARQVRALCRPGDLLILHTSSGQSPNLLAAARAAKEKGVQVIGFLGKGGGALKPLCDEAFVVEGEVTSHIQEIHLAVEHLIVELVELAMAK
ncbi:MAG TPA: SIS domain-containing protein [Gemmatimonadales bacterium]|nr:SIS domain-containing protein [Gemmatimonadales bacterium]